MAQARVKARSRARRPCSRRALRALRRVPAHRGVDRRGLSRGSSPTPRPSPPGARHLRRRTAMWAAAGGSSSPTSVRPCAAGGSSGSPGGRWLGRGLGGRPAARAGIPGGPLVGAVGVFALIGARRGRAARGGRLDAGRFLAGAARGRRAPDRARPRRVFPARRRAGRRGPVRAVVLAAAGGRPSSGPSRRRPSPSRSAYRRR